MIRGERHLGEIVVERARGVFANIPTFAQRLRGMLPHNSAETNIHVKTIKIEDFNPAEAQDFILHGWEYSSTGSHMSRLDIPGALEFIQSGWQFMRYFQGEEWLLSVHSMQKNRGVSLSTRSNRLELETRAVDTVEFDDFRKHLIFVGKGGNYYVSANGLQHSIQSVDGTVTARKYFTP